MRSSAIDSLAMFLAVCSAPQSVAQASQERQPPAALRAFREARRQIASGRIDWTVALPDNVRTIRYVSRYAANGDMIFENRGDKDGWTNYDLGGAGNSKFPELYLQTRGTIWKYRETSANASVWPPGSPATSMIPKLKDARAVGIFPTSESIETPLESNAAWESRQDPVFSYEERREGNLVIVTGVHGSGSTMQWTLAPEQGWNAVEIVSESPKGTLTSVENKLAKYGDVWLPSETTYRRNGDLEAVVRLENVSVNQPDDPAGFTPNDIGLEAGINLAIQTDKPGTRVKIWNGEEISEADRYHREVDLGIRTPGKVLREIAEKGYFDSPYLSPEERRIRALNAAKRQIQEGTQTYRSLWRRYVDAFIKRYDLNEEQKQKAYAILKQCEDGAKPHAEKLEAKWSEYQIKLQEAGREKNADLALKLRNEWTKLNEPIDAIFTNRLVPALEKIPTRAQRKAVEFQAETGEIKREISESDNSQSP